MKTARRGSDSPGRPPGVVSFAGPGSVSLLYARRDRRSRRKNILVVLAETRGDEISMELDDYRFVKEVPA